MNSMSRSLDGCLSVLLQNPGPGTPKVAGDNGRTNRFEHQRLDRTFGGGDRLLHTELPAGFSARLVLEVYPRLTGCNPITTKACCRRASRKTWRLFTPAVAFPHRVPFSEDRTDTEEQCPPRRSLEPGQVSGDIDFSADGLPWRTAGETCTLLLAFPGAKGSKRTVPKIVPSGRLDALRCK